MGRRKDPVSSIVGWFQTEPLDTAQMLYKVVGGLLAARTTAAAPTAVPAQKSRPRASTRGKRAKPGLAPGFSVPSGVAVTLGNANTAS